MVYSRRNRTILSVMGYSVPHAVQASAPASISLPSRKRFRSSALQRSAAASSTRWKSPSAPRNARTAASRFSAPLSVKYAARDATKLVSPGAVHRDALATVARSCAGKSQRGHLRMLRRNGFMGRNFGVLQLGQKRRPSMHTDDEDIEAALRLVCAGDSVSREDVHAFFAAVRKKLGVASLVEHLRKFKFERVVGMRVSEALLSGPVPYFPFTDMRPLSECAAGVPPGVDVERVPGFTRFPYRRGAEVLGHVSQVVRVAFDRTDRFFFTGSDDGMLKLWEAATGLLVHSFIGHRFCVNDICISSDNRILCSVDTLGLLNVWSLADFALCFSMDVSQDVDFIEFVRTVDSADAQAGAGGVYQMVLVERRGAIRVVTFTLDNIISDHENSTISEFAGDSPIQTVCITEGGRFLLCGGQYPFLIVFDLHHVRDNLLVLETEGYSIVFVIASRTNLKFAAATGFETVLVWEFQPDTVLRSAHSRRKTRPDGCWRKSTVDLRGTERRLQRVSEDLCCEQMCFLADDRYLVCMCSDARVRIYLCGVLHRVVEHGIGVLTPHPVENAFVVCNERVAILSLDSVLLDDGLTFSVMDSQFSSDGQHLVLCDEIGRVRIYAVDLLGYASTPAEQFFASDFVHLGSGYAASYYVECEGGRTFDYARNENTGWRPVRFEPGAVARDQRCAELEALGYEHLRDDFLTVRSFKKKYFVIDEKEETQSVSTLHSNEILSSDDCFSALSTEAMEAESDSDIVQVRRLHVPRAAGGASDDACSLGTSFSFSSSLPTSTDSEERISRRRGLAQRSTGAAASSAGSSAKRRRTRDAEPPPATTVVDDAVRERVRSWMLCTESHWYFPQIDDEVRFLADRYRAFLETETRDVFECNHPLEDCDLVIVDMAFVKYEPCYVVLDLKSTETNALYQVKYYDTGHMQPVFVLLASYAALQATKFAVGAEYAYAEADRLLRGRCTRVLRSCVELQLLPAHGDTRGETVRVAKTDLHVESGVEMPRKDELVGILEQNKRNKMIYTHIRRNSNISYDEHVSYPLNFSVILQRIRNNVYRRVASLRFDLEAMRCNSRYLPRGYEECVRAILSEIYGLLDIEHMHRHRRRRQQSFASSR